VKKLSGYVFSPLRGETSLSTGAPATAWRQSIRTHHAGVRPRLHSSAIPSVPSFNPSPMIICRQRQRFASFSCHSWDSLRRPISKSLSPDGLARPLTRTHCQPNRRSRRSTRRWFNVSTALTKTTAHARSSWEKQRSFASLAATILTMIMARWPDAFSTDFVGARTKISPSKFSVRQSLMA
jgi:hypothetical protein